MPLNPGDTLLNGQYCILRQIGRGGYGFVYQADDRLLAEEVAIKELIPALVGDETALRRFLAEAKATMRLAHDHVVRTHNVFSEGGNYYIVMEYMPGGSLEARLGGGATLPVPEAVRITAEVCQGLSYAHERGVIHCDLKPANILFDRADSAKVADFGIAHVSGETLTRSWQTPSGFVAGTLPYMSPEQTDGVRDDPRVDVYALGAVLYRMLAGQTYLNFDPRETPRAQSDNVQRIYQVTPRPPSAHNHQVPAWLDGIVMKALAKQPEQRFAGTAQLRAALLQALPAAAPVPPRRTPPSPPSSEPVRAAQGLPRWFWPAAAAAGVLLLALIAGAVFLLTGGPESTPAPSQTIVILVTATASTTPSPLPASTSSATATPSALPTFTATPQSTYTAVPLTPTQAPPTDTPTPAPTPTAVPTAAPAPTATPIVVGKLLFSDDFSNTKLNKTTSESYTTAVVAGQFEIKVTGADNWMAWSYYGETYWDFVLEASARWVEGAEEWYYGLVFRRQDEGLYDFLIYSDGTYEVNKRVNGKWIIMRSGSRPEVMQLGAGANVLRVSGRGSEITIWVNGQFLDQIEDATWGSGKLGIAAGKKSGPMVRVAFDNLKVWALPAGGR